MPAPVPIRRCTDGDVNADFARFANMADAKLSEFASDPYTVHTPLANPPKYDDWIPKRQDSTDVAAPADGRSRAYQPNAWGLFDMHGNASEWTHARSRPRTMRTATQNRWPGVLSVVARGAIPA